MKVNKDKLLLRIITYPIHLVFMLSWQLCEGIWLSYKWLLYGSEHVIFLKTDHKASIAELNRRAEQIINRLDNAE